ncbi:uncharacterized protein LOC132755254 [Ruditapes philippinarum]|uniref:uncharacterized protein LOC132755254 n=1 Tax=Ruditapes philippinarum TaxID=129788 RepID=UPI00295AAC97|nr:uncharacterized protein LOC132755254 [Ruditapes philippinarum]
MIFIVILVALVTFPVQANGLQCRVCKNVAALEDCTETETCEPNSVCYTDEKIIASRVLFEAGCRPRSVCQAAGRRKRDDGALIACSRCCDTSEQVSPLGIKHCNERLCGLGRIAGVHECYHCERTRDLNDCNKIETCQQDEVCSVEEEDDVNNITTYSMKCSKTHPCIEVTTFRIQNENLFANGVIVGKRNGLTTCSACCGGPLCNTGGCFQLVKKLRKLWKVGSLDSSTLTYVPPNTATTTSSVLVPTKP